MPDTPLLDALRRLAGQSPLRMHMPGHKGKPLPVEELSAASLLDFTELPPTGDLFAGGGPIEAAEQLWARVFSMPCCLFLTGGATQGLQAALTLTCPPGAPLLLDRASHRAAFHAAALLDLRPLYLERPWLEEDAVAGPITPGQVEDQLKKRPDIKTICITSPTYYGILSDIPALAETAHRYGARLVVDAAHGAHLPFLGNRELAAADVVVTSAHKTLPALGQSALLLAGEAFSQEDLHQAAGLWGSSSPSYVLMAALDGARAFLEGEGGAAYRRAAEETAGLRRDYPSLGGDLPLDPTRFVLRTEDGFAAQASLQSAGVWPEMADRGHVVFILTCADAGEDFTRLRRALNLLPWRTPAPCLPPPPPPAGEMTLRRALFSSRQALPLAQAAGQIAAQSIAPYPPGIPVVAPGERIEKKTIAYFEQIGYNMLEDVQVVCL